MSGSLFTWQDVHLHEVLPLRSIPEFLLQTVRILERERERKRGGLCYFEVSIR